MKMLGLSVPRMNFLNICFNVSIGCLKSLYLFLSFFFCSPTILYHTRQSYWAMYLMIVCFTPDKVNLESNTLFTLENWDHIHRLMLHDVKLCESSLECALFGFLIEFYSLFCLFNIWVRSPQCRKKVTNFREPQRFCFSCWLQTTQNTVSLITAR